jgi:PAS domain S-box-containing protein
VSTNDERLELFFSQSLDGFFFMMIDEPVRWDDSVDKEAALDYIFEHQRITKVNDAMLTQYRATPEQFLGLRPRDLFEHNLAYGRGVWRTFFDRGRLHLETDERRFDGTQMWIEGDYICFHDAEGRITGHFGIQRDVSDRKLAEVTLRKANHRLQVLHDTHVAILDSHSPQGIAQATMRHLPQLIPCRRASVATFDMARSLATIIALHSEHPTEVVDGTEVPLEHFGSIESLREGIVRVVADVDAAAPPLAALRREGVRSLINVPMIAGGELIGGLNIGFDTVDAATPEAITIARELAGTLGVALRQAQLHERIEQHAAVLETRVAQRTAELLRSENRLWAIANSLPDPVFVFDEDGRYAEILTTQDHLLYARKEDMKGRRMHDVLPKAAADAAYELIHRTLQTRQPQVTEYMLPVRVGERWFEGRTNPLDMEINQKRCVVFVARDLTDRKRAQELESQNVYLQEELKAERSFGDIIGRAKAMQHVFTAVNMVAGTDSTVLVLGETGTGKELIARAIHTTGKRSKGVMVKVNCGALPASLAESELFGHERGAFTGAVAMKKGRFELAHRGTIFLDEVGELTPEIQVKLLRVLQEQEVERVGGTQTIKVDVRVIAATNRDLRQDVDRGTFRADLFYRLNIFPIEVPPLRERIEDVPLLAEHFVGEFARRIGKPVPRIHESALRRLTGHLWPGNVRELANALERAVILSQRGVILEDHLAIGDRRPLPSESFLTLEEMERRHIQRALDEAGGVLAGPRGAAALLGMSRSTVWSRMRKLGINVRPRP